MESHEHQRLKDNDKKPIVDDIGDYVGADGYIEALKACDETDGNLTYAQITHIEEDTARKYAEQRAHQYRQFLNISLN